MCCNLSAGKARSGGRGKILIWRLIRFITILIVILFFLLLGLFFPCLLPSLVLSLPASFAWVLCSHGTAGGGGRNADSSGVGRYMYAGEGGRTAGKTASCTAGCTAERTGGEYTCTWKTQTAVYNRPTNNLY